MIHLQGEDSFWWSVAIYEFLPDKTQEASEEEIISAIRLYVQNRQEAISDEDARIIAKAIYQDWHPSPPVYDDETPEVISKWGDK